MSDPWLAQSSNNTTQIDTNGHANDFGLEATVRLGFEDNFAQRNDQHQPPEDGNPPEVISKSTESNCNVHEPLPDSATYLQGLERKLKKLKADSKIVEALAEKKNDCWRSLLQTDEYSTSACDAQLELDAPVGNSANSSTVNEIYRHLQPVQAVTVGETVNIVEHDQLEQQHQATEGESTPETDISQQVFLFLTDLAWKSRLTIPVLVTTVFLIMDIRLQIEVNLQSGQVAAAEFDQLEDSDDDDTNDVDEEYTTDGSSDDLDADTENDGEESDYENTANRIRLSLGLS